MSQSGPPQNPRLGRYLCETSVEANSVSKREALHKNNGLIPYCDGLCCGICTQHIGPRPQY